MSPRLAIAGALLLAACSPDAEGDVPPLPRQTAETANALMAQAERAAADAQSRMEQGASPTRSRIMTNEVNQ